MGVFILFGTQWKKEPVAAEKIFAVQVVSIPKTNLEKKTAPISAPSREIPVQRQPEVKKTPRVRPSKVEKEPTEKAVFSSSEFRERLASKIEIQDSPFSGERRQRQPVEVEKIESVLVDVTTPQLNVTIPEWYIALVRDKIKENWNIYSMLGKRTTTVSFRIDRTGSIGNIAVELSSGSGSFDKSVVDAVKSTRGLPVFPEEIRRPYLDVVIEFTTEG